MKQMRTWLTQKIVLWVLGAITILVLAVALPDQTLLTLAASSVYLMALPATYFPIFYTLAFRWWQGHLGRALFIKAFGLMLLIDVTVLFQIFGEQKWGEEIQFVVFAVVLVGLTYQSVVMTMIRFKARRPTSAPRDDLDGVEMH